MCNGGVQGGSFLPAWAPELELLKIARSLFSWRKNRCRIDPESCLGGILMATIGIPIVNKEVFMAILIAVVVILAVIIGTAVWLQRRDQARGASSPSGRFTQCSNCGSYLCDGKKCLPGGGREEPTAFREIT